MTRAEFVSRCLSRVPLSVRHYIKDIPGIAQLQRRLVSKLLDGREFIHKVDAGPAKGISFLIRLPQDKGIWTGTYEIQFARRLAAAVRPGTIGYDIGGWHGYFAGVMAANGAQAVHVFEPHPHNASCIRKMIELNAAKSITLHAVAIGESDVEMNLLLMPETSMAKLEASCFQQSAESQQKIRVNVRKLNSILNTSRAPPPTLMKIDVEGAELLVLQGARTTLRVYHPEIFAEIHSATLLEQCTALLLTEGYRIELLDVDPIRNSSKDICQIRAFFSSHKRQ